MTSKGWTARVAEPPHGTILAQTDCELGPKDLRVKNQWVKHATVKGATGVKIVGRDDLEKALAGLPLYVARRDDEVEYFKDLLERKRIKLTRMATSGPDQRCPSSVLVQI